MNFLTHYVMLSLRQKPKSGYELIKEIHDKTDGNMNVSKGTLYPLLERLENDNLIQVKETGPRGKKTYELTEEGRKNLSEIHRKKEGFKEHSKNMRRIFVDFIGTDIEKKLKDIEETAGKTDKKSALEALDKCLRELKG